MNKLIARLSEFQKSEQAFVDNMRVLCVLLTSFQQDARWSLGPNQISVLDRVKNMLETDGEKPSLVSLHSTFCNSLRRIEYAAGYNHLRAIKGLRDIFEICIHPEKEMGRSMVDLHAEFDIFSGQVMFHLQKKAGGQVKGDRAIGTLPKAEGSLASALADLQSLLVLPSQSVARYRLFIDEMIREARSDLTAESSPEQVSEMIAALEVERPHNLYAPRLPVPAFCFPCF
jgi:hypothetical protein